MYAKTQFLIIFLVLEVLLLKNEDAVKAQG